MIRLLTRLGAVGLALAGATATASGTVNPGTAAGGDQQLYNAGKVVFAQKLVCGSCAYANRSPSAELARQVLTDSKTFGALAPQEQQALQTYFRKRFGVEQ